MLIKSFKANYFLQIIFLLGISILLWFPAFCNPVPLPESNHYAPLYGIFAKMLSSSPLIATLIAFLLVLGQAALLNSIFSQNGLIAKTTLFQAIFFVMLSSFNISVIYLTPIILANIFLLLTIKNVIAAFDASDTLGAFFNSSFFVALASLFCFPLIVFWIWILIAFFVYKIYNWRSFFVSILGLLAPFTLLFTYYFMTDSLTENIVQLSNEFMKLPNFAPHWEKSNIVYFAIGIPLFFCIFLPFFGSIHEYTISFRKKANLMAFYFLIAFIPCFYTGFSSIGYTLFAPAVSFFFTLFFYGKSKPIILNIVTVLILLITILNVYWQ